MIVYADRKTTYNTRDYLARLRTLSGLDLLIAFGQFESGVVDALSPEQDCTNPAIRALRYAAVSTARAWMGLHARPPLGPVEALELPATFEAGVPEGYAWYALYPDMYVAAARRFLLEVEPARSVVIGIRSIGTSLSAVVAAAVDAVISITVRPHGHPFERYVVFSQELTERLRMQRGAHYLVVDEGPGISGSSFTAVARALEQLGVPDDRIVFFPSWQTDGTALRSEEARKRWPRHRQYFAEFEDVILPKLGEVADVSAGAWRSRVYDDESSWPAVQPRHERRKYLRDGRTLLKFAGLGEYGRTKVNRALLLSDLGYGPEVLGYHDGFIATRWEPGRPVAAVSPALVERISEYLEFLSRCAVTPGPIRYDEIVQMMEHNTGRSFRCDRALIEDAPLVKTDCRMLRHEWIETARGIIKADGVDHHDDHFFPGCQDIAWDYAAAGVEFGIPAESLTREAALLRRIPFYRAAYSAFRFGYCRMAEDALGESADGLRFAGEARRYRAVWESST